MALVKKSEYFSTLSVEAKKRYESKVSVGGFNQDPYTVKETEWTRELHAIPHLTWSDLMVYTVFTRSRRTKEAIKVGRERL